MKAFFILFITLISYQIGFSQTYNAAYVKALYAKYPTQKSDFCKACKIWVNPFYTSIADTEKHMPLVTFEKLTAANYAKVKVLKLARTGVFAAWSSVVGQPSEDKVYVAANKIVKPKGDEIAKGHCNCWIINSWCQDAAIFSDTYTFNAAMESQGQNVGTEIETENITRKLLEKMDVNEWVGTFGSEATFTDGKITDTEPAFYWKIIQYGGVTTAYWMPNNKSENQSMLTKRMVTLQQLIQNLGFDPTKVIKAN